jgi:tetratricopeptide (TPR) repeat protein
MEPEAIYTRALSALQAGQLAEARRLLAQVIQADPHHEQAWLSLASVVPNIDQSMDCLEHVVALNPENEQALNLLEQARKEMVRREVLAMLEGPAPVVEGKRVSRLGEYLLRAQFITSQQLEFALAEQQKTAGSEMPRKLGEILVERGDITSQQLEQGIRDQHQDFNNLFVD